MVQEKPPSLISSPQRYPETTKHFFAYRSLLSLANWTRLTTPLNRALYKRLVSKNDILGRSHFHYEILHKGTKNEFDLGDLGLNYLDLSGRTQRLPIARTTDGADSLNQLVRLKWLSIHRTPSKLRTNEQPSSEPSVDRRLTQLGNLLVRYFSKLAAKRDDETSTFLKRIFPILASQSSDEDDIFAQAKAIDLAVLRESLDELIQELSLGGRTLQKNLDAHFQLAAGAVDKDAYSSAELAALIASITMQKVAGQWNRSLVRQSEIAQPRREFLEIINSMFVGKQLAINQRNELEAILPSDKHLQLSDLSSGEKQLLIIMAEALLQERAEFIYIADEPELSLHVRWQEQLTRNLRKINPKAQVIFATHSPDIVSEYADRTIDVERLK